MIVWAPTGEQFYYASRQVVKKNLIKSNLILPKAILEYQESLHMQPASIPVSNKIIISYFQIEIGFFIETSYKAHTKFK